MCLCACVHVCVRACVHVREERVSECECAGVYVLCVIVCVNVCETVWKSLCVCDCE